MHKMQTRSQAKLAELRRVAKRVHEAAYYWDYWMEQEEPQDPDIEIPNFWGLHEEAWLLTERLEEAHDVSCARKWLPFTEEVLRDFRRWIQLPNCRLSETRRQKILESLEQFVSLLAK